MEFFALYPLQVVQEQMGVHIINNEKVPVPGFKCNFRAVHDSIFCIFSTDDIEDKTRKKKVEKHLLNHPSYGGEGWVEGKPIFGSKTDASYDKKFYIGNPIEREKEQYIKELKRSVKVLNDEFDELNTEERNELYRKQQELLEFGIETTGLKFKDDTPAFEVVTETEKKAPSSKKKKYRQGATTTRNQPESED